MFVTQYDACQNQHFHTSKSAHLTMLDKLEFFELFHKFTKIYIELRFNTQHLERHHSNENIGRFIG